jgi:hypothetical protein
MWYDLKVLEDGIVCLMDLVHANTLTFWQWSKNKAIVFLNGPFVQSIAISVIIFAGNAQARSYLFLKHVYDNNEIVRVPTDFAIWLHESFETINTSHRLEPPSKSWLNVCSSIKLIRGAHVGKTPYSFAESYNKLNDLTEKDDMIHSFEVALENNAAEAIDASKYQEDDTIAIMKWDGLYKVIRAKIPMRPLTYDLERSSVRFLSVEYRTVLCKSVISLTVPQEMCLKGNELFSHAFVRRLLEYQPEPFEFDFNYRLTVMDGSVNEFELTSTQYIVLGENDYEVKEL